MNEAFKRVFDEAIAKIDESDKKAREAAVQAKKDLRALSEFAESLPHRMLDTMSAFATAEIKFDERNWCNYEASLGIGGHSTRLDGFRLPLNGKYRAIVILQRME